MTPQDVLNRIEAFVTKYPESAFSFGHIFLSDINLSHHCIDFCLQSNQIWDWVLAQRGEMRDDRIFRVAVATIDFLASFRLMSDKLLEAAEELYHNMEVIEE